MRVPKVDSLCIEFLPERFLPDHNRPGQERETLETRQMQQLEFFSEESDHLVGVHHAHHALLGIDHRQLVQVVLVK
jgi:hypothetical protein